MHIIGNLIDRVRAVRGKTILLSKLTVAMFLRSREDYFGEASPTSLRCLQQKLLRGPGRKSSCITTRNDLAIAL